MAAVNYGYCSENSKGGKLLCTLFCQLLGQCQRMHCLSQASESVLCQF